jgi:serine protease Do
MILLLLVPASSQAAEKSKSVDLSTAIIQIASQNIPAVVAIEVTERQEVVNPFLPFQQEPLFRRFFNISKLMRSMEARPRGPG